MPFPRSIWPLLITMSVVSWPHAMVSQSAVAQGPTPVMEYASLLGSVDVKPNGLLVLGGKNDTLTTTFLPQGAQVEAVLTKSGSTNPLLVQDFYLDRVTEVFSRIDSKGKYKPFTFTEEGDYVITFRTGKQVMTQLAFRVYSRKSGDEFNPQTVWYATGPWEKWAYAFSRLRDGVDGQLQFHMWARRESFQGGRDSVIYEAELRKDGDTLATSSKNYVASTEWRNLEFKMALPETKGGRAFRMKDLVARDGTYDLVIKQDQQLYAVHRLSIQGGKPVPHARQLRDYQPRSEYLVPRYAALHTRGEEGNMFWMERLDESNARSIAAAGPAEVAGPSDEQLKNWQWLPTSIDPKRPFKLHTTEIETRSDTHLAVGEDLIVFGTGFPTGVKYLLAGEDKAREIPGGELYSSTLFQVCGRKIILVRKNQVAVYDTETDQLHEIPSKDVTLYNPVGGLHRGNQLQTDGYLVATVNRADAVTDGNIVKVIDVSESEPIVIPIKNANYNDRQVSSVDVDAKHGLVAVSSSEASLIAVAQVAPLANQRTFDVSEFRGVDRQQIFLEDDWVVYADRDRKIRLLTPGESNPQAITEQPFGSSSNGFFVRKGRLVTMTQQHTGTRYEVAISDLPNKPKVIGGTGEAIPGTSGGLGMGGTAALAIDKTVFIAGTPSGGIGVGEHLQMFDEDRGSWVPLKDKEGNVISAIDVTTSIGFMAFKTGDRRSETTLGYATYGERIQPPSQPTSSGQAMVESAINSSKTPPPLMLSEDNPYSTKDELANTMLASFLETEKSVGEAYTAAFGAAEGKQKTVEMVLKSLQSSGNEALIPAYLAQSKYADEKSRKAYQPKAENGEGPGPAAEAAVQAVLNGQWKAARFNAEGNDLPDQAVESVSLTFANGKFVMAMGPNIQTGSYSLNTSVFPFEMEIQILTGPNQGEKRLGIFKPLQNDYLLMAFGTDQEYRPAVFVPDAQGKQILAAYSKVK